ncbi:MAG: diguanylate cyclase [Chloroflexi bacterium]|nr:diguanylate cyclase [Chloroflexota bacterium]
MTLRIARGNLTDQVGDNFQSDAESLSELVQLYLTANINEVQQLASAPVLHQAAVQRNGEYQGEPVEILAQLLRLDEEWRAAPDDDPLIMSVVSHGHLEDPSTHSNVDPAGHALSRFLELFDEHSEIFITDRYGGSIAATGRLSDYYQADEGWWQAAWNDGEGAVYISDPEFDESAGVTALLIAVPLVDDQQQIVGVLRSTLNVEGLFEVLEHATLGETGYAALLAEDATPLFDPGSGTSKALASLAPDFLQRLTSADMNSVVGAGAIFGHEQLGSTRAAFPVTSPAGESAIQAVSDLGWYVVFRQDTGEALSTLNLIERVAWISGAVAILIGGVVAIIIAQAVTRPLTRLTSAARAFGSGSLDVRFPTSGADEIGALTSAFRVMAERLQTMIRTLEARSEDLSQANDALEGEVAERRRTEDALREQGRRDPLTGVLNHAAIIEELISTLAETSDAASHTVAMLDVDGLKAVNDTYGHRTGDEVLVGVARALSRPGAVVGRYGGDEFVVVLRGMDRREAERYRDAVLDTLADAKITDPETGTRVPAVATIGLAVYPEDAQTIDELIRFSDSAMYGARRQRAAGANALTSLPELGTDRAAELVGQMVPILTAHGDVNHKLQLVSQRLSAGAGYDAVNVSMFGPLPGKPAAHSTFAHVSEELVDAWNDGQRDPAAQMHPIRTMFERAPHAVILDDPWNDELLLETQRDLLRAADLKSVLVAPLRWDDQVIGSLGVAAKRENAFRASDAQFLDNVASHVTAIIRMATLVDQLETSSKQLIEAHEETVMLLAAAAEAHDDMTGRHLKSIRELTEALAAELGYADDDVKQLGLAAVLHDIGKIRVPGKILSSPGRLAEAEWAVMKNHAAWGATFLTGRTGFELAVTVARSHHERWDGSGYPDGLAGEDIAEAATIVSVADAFDAIASGRPYRQARSIAVAVEEIVAFSGSQFSPAVVECLVSLHQRNMLSGLDSHASPNAA